MTEPGWPSQSERPPAAGGADSLADDLLDELVPSEIDWRGVVTSHPLLAIGAVAAFGFWLGRSRGSAILGGLAALATDTVNESVNELVGRDLF